MNKLSVVIITFNEEKNIGRCIDSVKTIADEVIVLDSFSTDRTIQIALSKGAIVHQHAFEGYVSQKNRAFRLANHNYILSLDADEALSAELADSILREKKDFRFRGYSMNRCSIYKGRCIRHGLWYPDKKLRLFDRRFGSCGGLDPHDKVVFEESAPVKHLRGDLLHYTYESYGEYLLRNEQVSTTAAESLFYSGKKVHWAKIFLSPLWAFFNGFFLRAGFLDGYYGWVIAVNTANQSYRKYYKLKQLQRKPLVKVQWQQTKTEPIKQPGCTTYSNIS